VAIKNAEETMPNIFKALSSIMVWVLFIFGLLRLLIGLIMAFTTGPQTAAWANYADFLLGIISLTLSAVVMKIRKSLE
jgi:hypothetical protein